MASAEAILTSIRRIYDAALTADAWQPALESITSLLHGDHAILFARDPAGGDSAMAKCAGMDTSDFARFQSPEAAWIGPAMAIHSGAVVTRSRLMPDREFERSEFYNDVVRPVGGFHGLGVCHNTPALTSFVVVCRRKPAGDFDAAAATALQSLSPHFATALRVRQRLGAADFSAAGAWAALERLSKAVIIVDAAAAVVFANASAERLFGQSGLRLKDGALCAGDDAASRRLRQLIARCAAVNISNIDAGGAVELARGDDLPPLRVAVSPLRSERMELPAAWCIRPLALLLITDPDRENHRQRIALQRRFGLTPAEADFALEIAKGDGRAAAAARFGISVGTARTHLTHIFDKTGARRQAELVRLLSRD